MGTYTANHSTQNFVTTINYATQVVEYDFDIEIENFKKEPIPNNLFENPTSSNFTQNIKITN